MPAGVHARPNAYQAFYDDIIQRIEGLRLIHNFMVRAVVVNPPRSAGVSLSAPSRTSDELLVEVAFRSCRVGTKDWRFPLMGDPAQLAPTALEIETVRVVDQVMRDLCAQGFMEEGRYRVVQREFSGGHAVGDVVRWTDVKDTVVWTGCDNRSYASAVGDKLLGRISQSGQDPSMRKIVRELQRRTGGGGWEAISRDQQPQAPPPPPARPGSTATQRARARASAAAANNAANRRTTLLPEEPSSPKPLPRPTPEETERERRRARDRRLSEEAAEVWEPTVVLLEQAVTAWSQAVIREAEERERWGDDDLLGGDMGAALDAGVGWVEAERAAQELRDFLSARVAEARARRLGDAEMLEEEDEASPSDYVFPEEELDGDVASKI